MHVFLAGATGAVGRPLVRQLINSGHQVTATTRSAAKAQELRQLGAAPVIVDGIDDAAMAAASASAQPGCCIRIIRAVFGQPGPELCDRLVHPTKLLKKKWGVQLQ